MRTFFEFRSQSAPALRGFTDEPLGARLPPDSGPWTYVRELNPDKEWPHGVSKAMVAAGVFENGFSLWDESVYAPPTSSNPVIESDRVEGTAVYDRRSNRIGSIKRLIIEKVSGRVISADVTFGGFLGLGEHHFPIPWEKLSYDVALGGYRTDVTAEEVRGVQVVYGDEELWPERRKEADTRDAWRLPPLSV
jgi:PRC-barrel domain